MGRFKIYSMSVTLGSGSEFLKPDGELINMCKPVKGIGQRHSSRAVCCIINRICNNELFSMKILYHVS